MGRFKRNSQRRQEKLRRKSVSELSPTEYMRDPNVNVSIQTGGGLDKYKYHLGILMVGLVIVLLLFSL